MGSWAQAPENFYSNLDIIHDKIKLNFRFWKKIYNFIHVINLRKYIRVYQKLCREIRPGFLFFPGGGYFNK